MSVPISVTTDRPIDTTRVLAGLLAVVVIVDTIAVRAPGLGLLAVPFLVATFAFTRRRLIPTVLLILWSLFFVLIGAAFAASNGFDAGWGDLLFAYVGTPAAALLAFVLVRQLVRR